MDDDQHRRAVLGGVGEGVDEVELQVERRREERGELRGSWRARGEEAERLEEERDEECDQGPEHDEEGEQCAGEGEVELETVSRPSPYAVGGLSAYQQLHRLVLWALFIVKVVHVVGNGLPRDICVRGRGLARTARGAFCLFGVDVGARGLRHGVDGILRGRDALHGAVLAGRGDAARRAGW